MKTLPELQVFEGLSGHTGDQQFNSLTCSLEVYASVVDEKEVDGVYADLVTTTYKDKETAVQYELWYQVRNPNSPEGMDFAYGFRQHP